MTTATTAEIGSVSSGTMRPEDLIPAFLSALGGLEHGKSAMLAVIERYSQLDGYYTTERASYDLEALFDALNDSSPPFAYFGAHEGDGADYGFWLSEDSIRDGIDEGEIVKIDAGDEWAKGVAPYVLAVTDHGNMTLYDGNTGAEVWGVV